MEKTTVLNKESYKKNTKVTNVKNLRKINISLLKEVTSVQSYSNHEERMKAFIKSKLQLINEKTPIAMFEDAYGNIYAIKGKSETYKGIVAHMDTVSPIVDSYRVYQQKNVLFVFSDALRTQTDIGGDDKVGVYACLQALVDFDNIKVVFFSNEEIGCLGSKYSMEHHKDFYKDINFIIQCDRKNDKDFIHTSGGHRICSENFVEACKPYMQNVGYSPCAGISTDVDKLVREGVGCSCVNLSSGYYNPHSKSSSIDIVDVARMYTLVFDIFDNLGHIYFEYKYEPPTYNFTNYSSKYTFKNAQLVFALHDNYDIKEGLFYSLNTTTITKKTNIKCPKCRQKDVYFDIEDTVFECYNCNEVFADRAYFKDFEMEGPIIPFGAVTHKYVFSPLYNAYLRKQEATWIPKLKCYVPNKKTKS